MSTNYPVGDSNLLRVWDNQLDNIVLNPETTLIDKGFIPKTPAAAQLLNYALNALGMKVNQNLLYGLPQWNENTVYVVGSGVQYEGKWYRCQAPNANKRPDIYSEDADDFWEDIKRELNINIVSPNNSITVNKESSVFSLTVAFNAEGTPISVFNPSLNAQILLNNANVDLSALRVGERYVIEAVNDLTLSLFNGVYRGGSALSTASSQFMNAGETLELLKMTDSITTRLA